MGVPNEQPEKKMSRRALLTAILVAIRATNKRLDRVIPVLERIDAHFSNMSEVMLRVPPDYMKEVLKIMPSFLAQTYFALEELGGVAMASAVSVVTKRARAVESGNLNQLERMGYVMKQRIGKRAYFSIGKIPETMETLLRKTKAESAKFVRKQTF